LVICTSATNGLKNTQDPTHFLFDKTAQKKPALQRTSSISGELRSKIPQIFKAIQPLLVSNSVKTKSAVFNLLNKLIEALQGGLDECLDSLIDLTLQNLKDKNQTLKLEALQFLRNVMENHDINILVNVPSKIMKDVLLSINENWYKIIAEGLRVLSTIISVIRPIDKVMSVDSNERYSAYAKQMFDSILSRVEALDIDQEIKVCAIGASGKLVAFLGDHMDPASVVTILTILRKRLENEITRISSLRSIIHIAGSPLKIDLSSILEPVISDLTSFLRQQSRLLKQTSLAAVGAILQSPTVRKLITGAVLDPLFKELSMLMIDSDLNLAQHALKVTIIIFEHYPTLISSSELMDCMVNHIFPKSIQLAYSPLLLGSCQLTLISFLQTIITLKIPNLGFKECFTALTSQSIDNFPRHSILNLAKCIAGICLKCDESDRNSTLKRFSKDIEEGKFSSKHLALLCVGELGQQYDMSNTVNLKELILNCFANELEDIKMAAAYALGHLAAGNPDIYLPSVLLSVDTSSTHPYQYFLLVSLKELIFLYANMSKQFQTHLQNILSGLLNICNTQEDSVRNMVAECLGALLIMHSDQIIPTLIDMSSAEDKYTRRTIATSLRHFFSRKLQKSESEVLVNDIIVLIFKLMGKKLKLSKLKYINVGCNYQRTDGKVHKFIIRY
jgi:cullin-associated NEDD8-dissociated protein 1